MMVQELKDLWNELNVLREKYDWQSIDEPDGVEYFYGKYWGIREAMQLLEKHGFDSLEHK